MNMAPKIICGAVLGLLIGASPAAAQDWKAPDPKAEPWVTARMRLGPIFMNPTFQIRDFGIDDNVFNDNDERAPRQDLTATLAMDSLIGLQARALLLTVTQSNSYVWYRRYRSERSADGGLKGVAELRLDRLRPWFSIERNRTHSRGGYEIDARAGRQLPAYDFGTDIRLGWRLGASVGYRTQRLRYAEEETFDGVNLSQVLDNKTNELRAYARYELTVFTNLIAGVELTKERYDVNTLRDSDFVFYYGGLESSTDAPLGLNLQVGWKEQTHKNPNVPSFKGVVANGSAGFVVSDFMRLDFNGVRDTGSSYDNRFPFYVEYGGFAGTQIRFSEHFDLKFDVRGEWLQYSKTVTGEEASRSDRTTIGGAEIGYYFGGLSGTRMGIRYEYTKRVSPIALKNYTRGRIFTDFRLSF